jgi:hypothetical protein
MGRAAADEEVLGMKHKKVAAILAVMALGVAAPSASAVGGPNEAGKSGHFHPNSGPCDGKADHPHCPGPH